jgi:phage terminase large subunit-like protein
LNFLFFLIVANKLATNTIIDKLKQTGFEVEAIRQTVSTLENIDHEVRFGHGDGVFVALRARKC